MTDESVVSRTKVHMRYFCKIVITYWIYSVISPQFFKIVYARDEFGFIYSSPRPPECDDLKSENFAFVKARARYRKTWQTFLNDIFTLLH